MTRPKRILFVGYCWGAAGSSWLSRVLNAHEDVLCLHAPILPRYDHFEVEDTTLLLRAVYKGKAFGGSYPVVGFTHGIPIEWQPTLGERIGVPLREFVLVRDPVPRVRSVVELHRRLWRADAMGPRFETAYRDVHAQLETLTGRTFPADLDARAFQNACQQTNAIVQEAATGLPIFRLEDLVQGTDALERLLAHVSDGRCSLEAARVSRLQGLRLGAHADRPLTADEIWSGWSPDERAAFRALLTPEARKAYEALGYALP